MPPIPCQHDIARLLADLRAAYPDDGACGMATTCHADVLRLELHRLFQLNEHDVQTVLARTAEILVDPSEDIDMQTIRTLLLTARIGSDWSALHHRLRTAAADGFAATRTRVRYDQSVHDADLIDVICLRRALSGYDDELHPWRYTSRAARIDYAILWSLAKLWPVGCNVPSVLLRTFAAECGATCDHTDVYLAAIVALFCVRTCAAVTDDISGTIERSTMTLGCLTRGGGDLVCLQIWSFIRNAHLPHQIRLHVSLILWRYLLSHDYLTLPLLIRTHREELFADILHLVGGQPDDSRLVADVFHMLARQIHNSSAFLEKGILARSCAHGYLTHRPALTVSDWVDVLYWGIALAAEITTEMGIGDDARAMMLSAIRGFFSHDSTHVDRVQLSRRIAAFTREHERVGAILRNQEWLRAVSDVVSQGVLSTKAT